MGTRSSLSRSPITTDGGTLAVRNVTVKNVALAPGTAGAFTLKFYLSDDGVLPPARAIPALGPGATSTLTTTLLIPATAPAGPSFLIARADALDAVFESDEGNNVAVLPLEVGDFVDFTISAIAGPATVKAGAPMTVSVTTRNAGPAPAGPFRVTLYMSQPFGPDALPGDGVGVGFKDIAGLAAGASVASSIVVTVPSGFAAGLYALSAVADADDAVPELGAADGATANGRVATRAVSVLSP